MRSIRIPWTAVLVVVLAAVPAWTLPREAVHPSDDTEVFTGAEETAREATPARPAIGYWKVRLTLRVPATERAVRVGVLMPLSDGRQDVLGRRVAAPGFQFRESVVTPNQRAEWTAERAGATAVTYDLAVRVVETTATPIPADPIASLPRPPEGEAALAPTLRVQSDAPEVRRRAQKIVGRATRLDEVIWSLYQYTAAFVPAADPPGPQDAVAVLAARRGTSLGRARTLTALLQAAGVPARLVGGLRLGTAAEKRATNSWVEAWTGSRWIPLDPAGGYFATLPTSYLALYRGDLPLIVHTAGVDVEYGFASPPATPRAGEGGEEDEEGALPAGPRAGGQLRAAAGPVRVALFPRELSRAAGHDEPAAHPPGARRPRGDGRRRRPLRAPRPRRAERPARRRPDHRRRGDGTPGGAHARLAPLPSHPAGRGGPGERPHGSAAALGARAGEPDRRDADGRGGGALEHRRAGARRGRRPPAELAPPPDAAVGPRRPRAGAALGAHADPHPADHRLARGDRPRRRRARDLRHVRAGDRLARLHHDGSPVGPRDLRRDRGARRAPAGGAAAPAPAGGVAARDPDRARVGGDGRPDTPRRRARYRTA